ncbi:hypothetical protein M758_11G132200 [Ceratodon purpureus]|nr:hypothetical protein M758_11G132200 [Ceratodon purpureus]
MWAASCMSSHHEAVALQWCGFNLQNGVGTDAQTVLLSAIRVLGAKSSDAHSQDKSLASSSRRSSSPRWTSRPHSSSSFVPLMDVFFRLQPSFVRYHDEVPVVGAFVK